MKLSDIRQRLRQLKWPLDTTGTIAFLALIISAIQLVVTAPMISELFVSPVLVVTGGGSDPKAKSLEGMFVVANTGNAPATKIEVGIALQIDHRLIFTPNIVTNTVQEKDAVLVKNVRIEIERLLPGEEMIIVAVPSKNGSQLDPDLANFMVQSGFKEFPAISYVRSAEGRGEIKHEKMKEIRKSTDSQRAPLLPKRAVSEAG